ncbi:hypothetical protein GS601_16100 [Myxacorys almedinensis A]|uniref:Uncharacterized protein n=1 Tax=Myxacorys almedinensis A TaxID=2690445 RepID=A0A8J7Z9A4_9CYAN|nr:hypothetical protein [Myxacorys almedinensis A]
MRYLPFVELTLILAIDGMQPDVGHEVLWVIREVLSGEILYEADRYAKKELKKRVRGVRQIERTGSQEPDNGMNEVVAGYCQAVRAALTDDGHPPLDASGLTLQQRLSAIDHSLEQMAQKGIYPSP